MNLERLSCRKRVQLLCDYLDRELPPKARKAVAAHRRYCLPCAEVLASLERTLGLLKGLRTSGQVPAATRRALRAAIAARVTGRSVA
jgi:anti-sigma factor RsiW